jgi:inorganic pyrophosphatase
MVIMKLKEPLFREAPQDLSSLRRHYPDQVHGYFSAYKNCEAPHKRSDNKVAKIVPKYLNANNKPGR